MLIVGEIERKRPYWQRVLRSLYGSNTYRCTEHNNIIAESSTPAAPPFPSHFTNRHLREALHLAWPGMAFADTAARKLLHGGSGGTVAQGVAEAGGISFFVGIMALFFIALKGAAHMLVLFIEALWWWLHTFLSSAAGFFHRTFVHQFAALACAAHKIPQKLEELPRWLQAATTVVLPFVLGVIAILLLVALIWLCGSTLRRCASSPWGSARPLCLCTPSATSGTACTASPSPRQSPGRSPDSCLPAHSAHSAEPSSP